MKETAAAGITGIMYRNPVLWVSAGEMNEKT
jgi:hypothetical protein